MGSLPEYAELHCLSNYTFLRGASHPEELVERASALGYAALALTDECSLAGVVRAHLAAKANGLKLLVGAEFRLEDETKLVMLAADRGAYGALSVFITSARRASPKGRYRVEEAQLERAAHAPGLLALHIPLCRRADDERRRARQIAELFPGRAWIALELHLEGDDAARFETARQLSAASGLRLVAAGDVHMHRRSRRRLQDALTAVRLGRPLAECGHALYPNGERHLRSRLRLAQLYPAELLAETVEVASRCTFRLDELRYEYPQELVPPGETPRSWLARLVAAGLDRRYPEGVPHKVCALVAKELALIAELGYEAFFLTVYDLVAFARARGILCQGRGSAANSAVCYALGITEVDPARMDLLFERFVSRERGEPPDIDVDFEHERREEVIRYVYEKYGRDRAALAATVIRYRARSAVRDLAQALAFPAAEVERCVHAAARWEAGETLAKRFAASGIDPAEPRTGSLLSLAETLIGFPRHLSQHVGGFVISRGPLAELVPVENAAMPGRTVIQWDKDDLEALGLLKVDVLGLGMLSVIRRALDEAGLRLEDIPAEDPGVYEMISRADTVGVFQVESRAQMAMLPRLRPRNFYDLVIEVAIVRPGPIQGGMVHPYLRRRAGLEPVDYPNEEVRAVLERTLGVPVFQEQVIRLAMLAAGFTPGEADALRRAMGVWRRQGSLAPFRERLVGGMVARGYAREFAEAVYRQILGFGEYGFPESHAASFALLVYTSAWLKRYRPAEFLAALLNSQPMGFYAPAQLVQDARRHGVEVRPVDVTTSQWDCTLEQAGKGRAVRLGLRLVKGIGEAAARRIVAARPFASVAELAEKAALSRGEVTALAAAGALASLTGHRRLAHWKAAGVENSSGTLFVGAALRESVVRLTAPSEAEDIAADYESLGLTLGRHPLALLRTALTQRAYVPVCTLAGLPDKALARTAGLVVCRQRPETASGVVFLTLEDETGSANLIVHRRLCEREGHAVAQARLLGAVGRVEREGEVVHLVVHALRDEGELLDGVFGELTPDCRDFH